MNLLTGGMAVYFSSHIVGFSGESVILIFAMLVVVCFNAGANAYNDYIDFETDKINRPLRPLSLGIISKNSALYSAIFFFLLGTIFAFQLSDESKIIGIGIALPLMILYSRYLKGRPLIGNFIIALILGLTFLFSGAAFGNISALFLPAILAFGLTFIRELVKDIADLEGDKQSQLHTYPIMAGTEKSVRLVAIFSAIVGVGAFIPYLIGMYSLVYGILLILGVEIPLGIVVASLLKNPEKKTAIHAAKLLKMSTIIGLLAIYLGSIYDI
ncbi:MAG: UbiA family prenyltransferase [Candidatus Marinimicrobia bacterium]|jgi:4-hydroxybenzoate polyprenyltransferase|nr:UbiA family prenyltransferase [Candidatus Neomarinimicrobiota bacterium]MBT3732040.1 UbiA family prenyltransferase [Candidatus Neomarinimicrobiota bacterium]MBT4144212.1 UbiA family prenyltransferase [Candidatus Neomarinimicrobiota bacterium]MBT4592692.1 UbiA family prenyltransferase [Candidatus Neomarinimicrobiota bacterium]MBT4991639.1 UbiA family prenyltransferase [Candidatus Neomarinimicrobiota bacterium]